MKTARPALEARDLGKPSEGKEGMLKETGKSVRTL